MAESSAAYHEPLELLAQATVEHHRALVSLMEELEAVDWYQQRIDATQDEQLKQLLTHNRDEEKEHAAMALEWLRRRDPALDKQLRLFLFTEAPIAEIAERAEEAEHGGGPAAAGKAADGSLGIGSLRGKET